MQVLNQQNKSSRYFNLIAAIFLIAVFLLALRPIADYDTGYHLATGEYIVTHKAVPLYDIFSYTALDARWIAHYWLADVIFYLVNFIAGFRGLIVFVALMAALTYYLILKTIWLKKGKSLLPLVLLMVFAYLSMELWVVRPQIFSYLLTVLLIYILERRKKLSNNGWLYALPLIFLVWANLHAGVVLGVAIVALYFFSEIISSRWNIKTVKTLSLAFLISSVATLINPNGYKIIIYNSIIAPAVKLMHVGEWEPLFDYLFKWQAKVFVAILAVSLAFVWYMVWNKKEDFHKRDWISLGLITGAVIMPLISVRHVGFFPIIALPVVSFYLTDLFEDKRISFDSIRFVVPLTFILGIVLVLGPLIRLPKMPLINTRQLPEGSANFILQNNLPAPILNSQHFGGYLIWKLWPGYKVFVDGRSEVFMGTPNDDYNAILYRTNGWEKLVNEKYKINTIILAYPDFANLSGASTYNAVTKRLGFVAVYFDDLSVVLIRNNARDKELIDRFGYKVISPFADVKGVKKELLSEALKEAQRARETSLDSTIVRSILEAVKIRMAQESITQ